MIERGLGNFGIFPGTDIDESRIGVKSGGPEHRGQKSRLVPADTMAGIEGIFHIVGFITGRFRLRDRAQVADLLGDKPEDRLDLPPRVFNSIGELCDFILDRGGGLQVGSG